MNIATSARFALASLSIALLGVLTLAFAGPQSSARAASIDAPHAVLAEIASDALPLLVPDTTERLRLCAFENSATTGYGFTHVSHGTVGNVRVLYPPIGPWTAEEAYAAMQGYNAQKGVLMGTDNDGTIAWDPPRHSTKGTELLWFDFGNVGNWPFIGEK